MSGEVSAATWPVTEARGEAPGSGAPIAGRYRLEARLGEGGHGEVWAAEDLVLREQVAVKILFSGAGVESARVRREIAALRLLRLVGVVRLLDEGTDAGGRPFLVMERVQGAPFPGDGAQGRWRWATLAGRTAALLEILAGVHAAGVVHRDLKPGNVLVSPEGRPTLLDFGLSTGQALGGGLTRTGQVLGTPAYLAPEQILGEQADARADLYAVGVMLFEALSGGLPHEADDIESLMRARLLKPAPALRDVAPEVPAQVAELVDRLLGRAPEERPRSAAEALSLLRGEPLPRGEPALPRLGGSAPVEAVVEAARAGRSIDIVGPPGSGRSRCLAEAVEALAREGKSVARPHPSRRPFASLEPLVGPLEAHAARRLDEVKAWIDEELGRRLAGGVVLAADDLDRLDRWSIAAIERCRGAGAVICVLGPEATARPHACVRLEALDEAALRPLFAGPDRIFHLREDAARLLWERSEGCPARVAEEIAAWTRTGLARWSHPTLSLDRDALNRLGAGLIVAPRVARARTMTALDTGPLDDLLMWLTLAFPHVDRPRLAAAMRQPLWRLEAEVEELALRGLATVLPDGRVAPRAQAEQPWPAARRREAHRALAAVLGPGEEGRLLHLLAADEPTQITDEALALGRRRARQGELGAAAAALSEGLLALRRRDDLAAVASDEEALLTEAVKVALAEATAPAADRVLYEICRAREPSPALENLDRLVRATLVAPSVGEERALALAASVAPFADPALERRRHRARLVAAGLQSLSAIEEALEEIRAWAETGEPLAALCLAEGLGMLRYRQGRFVEAARLRDEIAAGEPWLTARVVAIVGAGSARMEAFLHREAIACAEEARSLAARCRNPHWEGRAEWLGRAAGYRLGTATAPDLELIEAITHLGSPDLEAQVCLAEGITAWRAGRLDLAETLTTRTATLWRRMGGGRRWSGLLAEAVATASRTIPPSDDEARSLAQRALVCPVPGIGLQVLGLLGPRHPDLRAEWAGALEGLCQQIAREHWALRMDVLTVEEARRGAGGEDR